MQSFSDGNDKNEKKGRPGHKDLKIETFCIYDQYEFICVSLKNLSTVVVVRDRQGANRETSILFLLDENKSLKHSRLFHLGVYAYFGFIIASGNKVCFSYGHIDEIKSFLCV